MTVVLIEHPYGVDYDRNTEESLHKIEDLESGSKRQMAAIMPHFFLSFFLRDSNESLNFTQKKLY